MSLEDLSIDNAILVKHGPEELARRKPQLSIGSKDTISQKLSPLLMKRLAFTKVVELTSQDSLDVFWINSDDDAVGNHLIDLYRERHEIQLIMLLSTNHALFQEYKVLVPFGCSSGTKDKVDGYVIR